MPKASAVVLSSGGLHSLVAAGLGNREFRIAMLHVKDGRATERQALSAFERQAAHLRPMKSLVVDGTFLRQLGMPPESGVVVNSTSSDPQAGMMPMRELNYLSIAAALARQLHATTILWGVQCEPKQSDALARNIEMVQIANQMLELLSPEAPLVIKTPLMGLEDHQVIELGYQMGLPFQMSWTCQMPIENPCMSCPACTRRTRAFRSAQLIDPAVVKPK